MKIIADFVQM